jgi:Phospholipase_D-nuclease N-terminal
MSRGAKKRWSELSTRQHAAVVGGGVVQVALQVAGLRDLRRRPADHVKGSKAMWAALSFVNTLGPLAYFAFGRRRVSRRWTTRWFIPWRRSG